jgi:pyruvate dehydrogenase E2 component (dihydrolipoamide acetyltransferase)
MNQVEEILLPDVGGEEVEVIEISVNVGDLLEEEDALIVVETDKDSMDVPAPFHGVVEAINVSVGDKITEGTLLCMLKKKESISPKNKSEEPQKTIVENKIEQSITSVVENVYVPDIGDDSDVDIIEVMIVAGDQVNFDDGLITLETEKASMDVPAPFAGKVVEVFVHAGDKASEGTLIATVEKDVVMTNTTEISAPSKMPTKTLAVKNDTLKLTIENDSKVLKTKSTKIYASPSVRKEAREYGVDLAFVKGSGRKNRILKEDIKTYVKEKLSKPIVQQHSGKGFDFPELKEIDYSKFGEIESIELTKIQKISGPSLHRNWVSIPHITQFDESDITELEHFRKEQNALADGFKLSPLVFVVKAVAKALSLHPRFNSSLSTDGQTLLLKKYIHIAIAVDTPKGLVVPVIRDVDKKGFKEIAHDMAQISSKAREGKLKLQDMQGACFTISSLGGIGGTAFTPIINAPEVAILGLSKSEIKPKWDGEKFEPRLMLPLSLSYDHRVIDGADGARFITTLSKLLGDIRLLSL